MEEDAVRQATGSTTVNTEATYMAHLAPLTEARRAVLK
jgi:hypothetical protein